MAQKKIPKAKRIVVAFYEEEFQQIEEQITEEQELLGEELNSRDIRSYFGLKPTHRSSSFKSQLKNEINEMSEEEQKKFLEEIKKKKGEE